MTRRRSPITMGIMGDFPLMPSFIRNNIVSAEDILKQIRTNEETAAKEAYDRYNADYYNSLIKPQPIVVAPEVPVQKVDLIGNAPKSKGIKYNKKGSEFVNDIYDSYYRAVRPGAASDEDAARQAKFLTQKAAFETGYGSHIANTHNYGGHRTKDKGWLAFDSMDDFTRRDVALLDKKWSNWRNAKNENDFVTSITTNQGRGHYAPRSEYQGYFGLTNKTNNYLNMGKRRLRCGGKINRPKAWIGAVIGAATSIIGSSIQADAKEKEEEERKRIQEHKNAIIRAQNLTQSLGLTQAAQKEYEDRFRINYKCGGRRKLANGAKITDGGPVLNLSTGGLYYAGDRVPYGEYVDLGPTHEERNSSGNTGTGWNVNGKKIETENKEVETISPTQMKVYSNSLELPNGMTPAEYVLNGGDENYAFNTQQIMNGDYGIGNKRRLRNGGCLSRPVGRINCATGGVIQYVNGMWQLKTKYPNSNNYYWQEISKEDADKYKALGYKVQQPSTNKNNINNNIVLNTDNTNKYNPGTPNKFGNISGLPNIGPGMIADEQNQKDGITDNLGNYWTPKKDSNISSGTGNKVATNKTIEPQNAYAKQYAKNNTRSSVVSSGTGRRRLSTNGQKSAPTIAASIPTSSTTTPSVYAPDYTEQQMLDYINQQTKTNAPMTPSAEEVHYTNPADKQLMDYKADVESGQIKPIGSKTVGDGTDLYGDTNKWGTVFKGSDWIGLAADAVGSIGSALIQAGAANSIQDPTAPVLLSPGKLITNWNIAPRLQEVKNSRLAMLRDTDEGISSSGRLARRNQINLATNQAANELWGEKTNKEVELLNADTLNQQGVHEKNVAYLNDYYNRLADARQRRALMRGQAWQMGLSGLSDAVGNFIDQGKQRYADQQAMSYYSALLPEEGRQWLLRNNVDFLRGNKRRRSLGS